MRVLILSWEYPPIVAGGLARHVRKLSENLVSEAGAEVHVLTRGSRDTPRHEVLAGVHVHRVPETSTPRDLDAFLAWVDRMNADMVAAGAELAEESDLVHGHDWLVAEAAEALARRTGVPYVTTIHATEYGRHQGWVDKHPQSHIHGVETWMARTADHVITCSHYMRGHVADVYDLDEARIDVIPNGIDPDDLQPAAPSDLEELRARFAAPDERLVLLVGRLVYEKGFQDALAALPGLIRRLGNVRYLVAGSGTHEAELKKQAQRLGIAEHGTFLGWIGDDVLHSLYRIADITVVPSIYEPFGLVALEAMASGCPCIVADTGGLREVVPNREVGLRFRAESPRSLAHWVARVLTDEDLRDRLVTEASEHVLRFDWGEIAVQTDALYRRVAAACPPPAVESASARSAH
ncbi:MAG: glycosyl transferase group 1 [Solirubrobacteraceae bacterium]|nr:glycosyl transferase group 1 [Solirubrobacteraceae bacterium]